MKRPFRAGAQGAAAALFFAGVAAFAQSPSPALSPQNLPALSPAPTERSVPPGPAISSKPAILQSPDVSPLDGSVATPDAARTARR